MKSGETKNNPSDSRSFAFHTASQLKFFLVDLYSNFLIDRCTLIAASLAFTSLLALVPLLTVVEFTFSSFPTFSAWKMSIIDLFFETLIPEIGDQLRNHLLMFSENATGLRTLGLALLIATALSLMGTIESSFNTIWKVRRKRPLVTRLLLYWSILTLGPLLIGLGIFVSSYLVSLVVSESQSNAPMVDGIILTILPFGLSTLAFSLLFYLIPNRPIVFRHAIVGGLISALFFETAKNLVTFFIASFPSQQIVYGAFAVIPIFFVWVYLSWIIVLLGAEITRCLGSLNRNQDKENAHNKMIDLLYCQYRILSTLHSHSIVGETINERQLTTTLDRFSYNVLVTSLNTLEEVNWIARNDKHDWILVRPLLTLNLQDLLQITPCFPLIQDVDKAIDLAIDLSFSSALKTIGDSQNNALKIPLATLAKQEPQ